MALLMHHDLDVNAFFGIASHKLSTPYNNVAIFEKFGGDMKALIIETPSADFRSHEHWFRS